MSRSRSSINVEKNSNPASVARVRSESSRWFSEIAGQAAHNTNVVWMVEFQEELVERLYRKMMALMEEGDGSVSDDEDDEDDDNSWAMVKREKKKGK